MSEPVSVFYHYTTIEGLRGIMAQGKIVPNPNPEPQNPGILGDVDLNNIPAPVYFTRMDPTNSKEAIAFNNYGDGWSRMLKHVEACIAVKIVPVPCLLEGTVRKGKVFRSIVAWTGGPLPLEFSKARPSVGILTLECISLIPKALHPPEPEPLTGFPPLSPENPNNHPRLPPPLLSGLPSAQSNPNLGNEVAEMKENQKLMMSKIFGLEIECADLRKELKKISSDKGDCDGASLENGDNASLGNGVFHPETTSKDFVSDAQWLFNNDDVLHDEKESDHETDMSQNDNTQLLSEAGKSDQNSQHNSDVANTSEPIAKVWEFFFHNLP